MGSVLNTKEILSGSEFKMDIEESKVTNKQENEKAYNCGDSNLVENEDLKIEGQNEAQMENLDTSNTKDDNEIEKKIREGIEDHICNEIDPSNLSQLEVKMIDSLQKEKKESDENPK